MSSFNYDIVYYVFILLFFICTVYKKYVYSSLLFLCIGGDCLGFLPDIQTKPNTLRFICLAFFCFMNFKMVIRSIRKDDVTRSAFNLSCFFIVSIIFSYLAYGLSLFEVLTSGLSYTMVMSIVVYFLLTKEEFHKLFTIVYYLTFVATLFYIYQIITADAILPTLNQEVVASRGIHEFMGVHRALFLAPTFMVSFIPISIFCKNIVPPPLRLFSPFVLAAGLIVTLARGHNIAMIACVMLLMYMTGSLRRYFNVILVFIAVYAILGGALTTRLSGGGGRSSSQEIIAVVRGDVDIGQALRGGGTFLYRIAWMIERGRYLVDHPDELIMGMRRTEEKDYLIKHYGFQLGTTDEFGNVWQLGTADIAYGLMMTRYGLIGTILLLRMLYLILKKLYKYRHHNELAMTLFAFLCSQFLAAFTSVVLTQPSYWITFFFMYDYAMCMVSEDKHNTTPALAAKY